MDPKQRAAEAALQYVRNNSLIGLGTGSTADYFLIGLANAINTGKITGVRGVPTSDKTEKRAAELGIPLLTLNQAGQLDVAVDGADEVDPHLDLIKGLGGALLREKIVEQNAKTLIIIADASKQVPRLGIKGPLPVEVAPFAHEAQAAFLKSLGCEPKLRRTADSANFITDNGNVIYDCRFTGGIADAKSLAAQLRARAGIIETGLFLGMAKIALIADDNSVQTLKRN